ncbi:hypothetical protein Csp2054_09095 [Curtobacterium sp. 'Ferrero']|uniref:hypothetical protein n=1 Tax=Curtobacterium sp. 'Ferrero' TaxID=2033654 RepID=UPI000BD7D7E3|nr:hypothetical protein [Curtobacterium sp. 'Ferrero']PCN48019.1 hypothetical protein Csp2054_09095 [Curtobacterium sp. 'Ferrero']
MSDKISVNGNEYWLVDAVRLGLVQPKHTPDVDVVPSEVWTNAEIDAWADSRSIDLAGAKTKAEKLAVIADFEYTVQPEAS